MASTEFATNYTSQAAPLVVPTVFLLAVIYFSTQFFGTKTVDLPDLGNKASEYFTNCPKLLREGYQKWSAFRMQTTRGPTVILSREHMVDLLKRPEEVPREFELPVIYDFQAKYTGMNTFNPVLIRVIREVLTPGIHRFAPRMSAEVGRLLPERLPDTTTPGSPEWAEIKPLDVIMPIVSIAAGSILVGPDLCRRREWIDTSIGWAHAVFRAGVNLKQWPWYLRPFVYKFIPEMRGLQAMRRMVADMVDPVVEQRAREAAKVGPAEWEKRKPDDFVQWYTDNRGDFPEPLGSAILGVGMVSINSTSNATVNAMYDLAARPEYQEPIRQEIMASLAANDGVLTKAALDKCHLLDSFLKESQRMNPEVYAFGKRILLSDFRLADGTLIPKGSYVCCPVEAVTHDPAHFPDPDAFDGYRHLRLRQSARGFAGEKHQWISTTAAFLNFGYGRHSCPGRFMAAMEIKIIFAYLLTGWDLRLPEGTGRPKTFQQADMALPAPEGRILLRTRASK